MSKHITYGLHAVYELLKKHANDVGRVLVLAGRNDRRVNEILALCSKHEVFVTAVQKNELDSYADGKHQGVIALGHVNSSSADRMMNEKQLYDRVNELKSPFFLILDGVTDPHNLGACLRTADAAGIDAVIIPKDKSASLNETVRKVASGAAESMPLVSVTNLARCLEKLKDNGIWIIGTDDEADRSLYQQDLEGPIALVVGSEGTGLRRLTREKCDYLVAIPMVGELSSLNVSVASGVALFEAVRQRSEARK